MHVIFTQDFGVLGLALVIFVIAFCVAMPFGIYVAMKKAAIAQGALEAEPTAARPATATKP